VGWRYFVKKIHHNHKKSQIMKKIAASVLKGLLVIALFTGGTVVLSTAGVKMVNEANAATYNQVYEYLVTRGYIVVTLNEGTRACPDWTAHTIKNNIHYTTTIHCTENGIVGNTDVAL
jgi:hypothetical protein